MDSIKINWKTDTRKLANLKHWDKNPRKISAEKANMLKDRISERGFHDVIKIDLHDIILSGNCRKEVLMELGYDQVNVLIPDRELTEEEMTKIGLESNMNDGEWDWAKLGEFDEDILRQIGFDDQELMINFGLSDAEAEDIDPERMKILEVMPPEAPKLKERIAIHFESIDDYNLVKKAVAEKRVGPDNILKILL